MSFRRILCCVLFACLIACFFVTPSTLSFDKSESSSRYRDEVLPILKQRCGQCHGAETQESNVRFDQLSIDLVNDRAAAQVWHEARNAINAGEMPPDDAPPLTNSERSTLVSWMSTSLQNAIAERASTEGRVVLRRLNNVEYQNTMFDLLGLEMDYTQDLPPDGTSRDGFRNNGQSLRMSAVQLEYHLATARRALQRVIVSGPPPKVFRHTFNKSNVGGWRGPTEQSNRLERAQKFLVKMVDNYPESGEFQIQVKARAELRPDKGYPMLEVSLGYRPDTEVHFRIIETREITSTETRQYQFRGRLENFPLPVRGQGKYPGLVVRLRNAYTDGSSIPNKISKFKKGDKEVNGFQPEPHMPALHIESAEFVGPYYSEWPPSTHRQIIFDSELRTVNESRYVREVLHRFMLRAFRRPPTDREVTAMAEFFDTVRQDFPTLEDAMRETLAMVLVQPDFLYLLEASGEEKREISDWELATRLSYFLWSTMPDQRLFELADNNLLHEPTVLKLEVRRMLADKRSSRFTDQFVRQWLRLDVLENVSVDRNYFPNFDNSLKRSMIRESSELFATLLQNNESARAMLQSDFTMLNEPLARHYGIPGIYGQRFRPVELLHPTHRGGLLGHAGILLANSTGSDSHPIRRAVWIRDRILGDPPAPPPPDVPDLDEEDPEFVKLSMREQLERHRAKESCASCHRSLDPWGIALENFDAVGLWRDVIKRKHGDTETSRPVNARDELPGGIVLGGAAELRRHLITQRADEFAESLVRNLLTYALGRTLELVDNEEVDDMTRRFKENGYRLRSLVELVVASPSFRTK